jgi:hypothetical protein
MCWSALCRCLNWEELKRLMATRLPFVLAPDLDISVALDLMDELLLHIRHSLNLPTTELVTRASVQPTTESPDRVFALQSDGNAERRRSSRRRDQPARLRYSIKTVRDGATLNIKDATPATTKVIDYLRQHPNQLQHEIADGLKMSKNTIANQLSLLAKQGALIKQDARSTSSR